MIEVKNLTKRFHDFTALEDVSCSIGSGCIYGMVGSNGAGKSTFLRALTGVYHRMPAKFSLTVSRCGIILL